jgi:hypothetical protein
MRVLALTVAAGAVLMAATHANAGSFPINNLNVTEDGLIERVAVRVYVHEGRRYCFYFNGWHGAGWYRCGYAFRRGLGWGGVYGWNDWSYGPYLRRHGHRIDRDGRGDRRGRVGIHSRSGRTDSNVEIRSRSTTRSGVETGPRVRRSTTGSGAGVNVQSGNSPKVQGGPTGEGAGGGANIRGGASAGGSGSTGSIGGTVSGPGGSPNR